MASIVEVEFVDIDGIGRSQLVHEVQDALGGEGGCAARRGPRRRLPRLRRRPRRVAHRVGERREDAAHIADDGVAHGRASGLIGIAGDLDQLGPGRQ